MPRKPKGQPVSAAPGQAYGERSRQEQSQEVVPMAAQRDPIEVASQFNPPMGGFADPVPGNEPLTSGMPAGAGPTQPPPLLTPTQNMVDQRIMRSLAPVVAALATQKEIAPETVAFLKRARALGVDKIDFNSGE